MGAEPLVPEDDDKPTVIALRGNCRWADGEDILNEAPPPAPVEPVMYDKDLREEF